MGYKIKSSSLTFYKPDYRSDIMIPIASGNVPAGSPISASEEFADKLDIVKHMIKNPAATFFVRVSGKSMIQAGIRDGDLLIVDRSLEPSNNRIAICLLNGEFTVKRLHIDEGKLYLMPENPDFKPIEIQENSDFEVWGIVSFVIHKT